MRRAASGRAAALRRLRHGASALRSAQQGGDLAGQPRTVELAVRDDHGGARLRHVARVARLMVGRGLRVGNQDGGQPGRRELEHRPAGARRREIGRDKRIGERLDVRVQVVVGRPPERVESLGQLVVVADAARVEHRARRGRSERVERGVVQPPRPERAAEDQQALLVGPDAEALASRAAVGFDGARGNRTTGEQVLAALALGQRKRQEDAPGEGREQAVRDPQVAVGLHQRQRQPQRATRETDRTRHIAAGTEHGVGLDAPQQPPGPPGRPERQCERPRGTERVAPVDAGHLERMEGIARRGHELRLGAPAAHEHDVRPELAQRVSDRERRHDVTRRPAGGDHDPCHRDLLRSP